MSKGYKLHGERDVLTKIRGKIESLLYMAILGVKGFEDMHVQTFLIKEDEANEELLDEATNQYIALAKALWRYILKN